MQRVKKLMVLPAALLLTSCTVMDVVGPRANGEIMSLAKQATADETSANAEWAELRTFHSAQLVDEALRLCGTDTAGETPSSCNVELDETDLPAADAGALLERTVVAADKVPKESVDLVVAQAVDAVALAPVDLDRIEGPLADDTASAADLLARENALYYGLGIALAHADGDLRARIGALREASHERTAALTRLLDGADGQALVPAAGYSFADGYAEPETADQAAELVKTMQDDLVKQWRYAAAHAESKQWREAAILLAAHAQRA